MLEFDDGDRLISQGQRRFYSVTEGREPFFGHDLKKAPAPTFFGLL